MEKKLHRFLVESIPNTPTFDLTDGQLVHQIHQVLKLKKGESCIFFMDGGPDIVVTITSSTPESISCEKIAERAAITNLRKVIAAVAIPKGDTFELIVQKLTELGVSEIVPLLTTRTVKQSIRADRLQAISDEALEQSGGATRVVINEPLTLEKCLAQFPFISVAFQKGAPSALPQSETVVCYIGPEGGWSDEDVALLDAHHTIWSSLGARTLRTETAAIIGVHLLV